MRSATVYILTCSRNRPACLLRLAHNIASLRISGALCGRVMWYVIDDTSFGHERLRQDDLRRVCATHDIQVVLVGPQQSQQILNALGSASGFCNVREWVREPGRGCWDAAGVRNLASCIAVSVAEPDDIICWIDDDIVLSEVSMEEGTNGYYKYERINDCVRNGRGFAAAVTQLEQSTVLVVGTRYVGVADLSMRHHITVALERAPRKGMAPCAAGPVCYHNVIWPASGLPVVLDYDGNGDGLRAYRSPCGVSSGFMVTRPTALLQAPFPRFYNEDLLWLFLLGAPSVIAGQSSIPVGHLPPPIGVPTVHHMLYQEIGELVFDALQTCSGVDEKADSTERILSLATEGVPEEDLRHHLRRRVAELRDLGADISSLFWHARVDVLRNVLDNVCTHLAKLDAGELASRIRQTARGVLHWRCVMACTHGKDAVVRALHALQ